MTNNNTDPIAWSAEKKRKRGGGEAKPFPRSLSGSKASRRKRTLIFFLRRTRA